MSKANRLPSMFAAGMGALSALAMGCGSANLSASGSAGAEGSSGLGTPVSYLHEASTSSPSLNLSTYRYIPSGTGISANAGQVSTHDGTVDYNLALRTASIKLRGDLPPMTDIMALQAAVIAGKTDGSAGDPSFVYNNLIHNYIFGVAGANGTYSSPLTFRNQMVQLWHNILKEGGTLTAAKGTTVSTMGTISLDTAPSFAASLVVNEADMRNLFTQTSGTCVTYNSTTGVFTPNSCTPFNNVPEGQQAGVLTDPGFQAQFYSNFGFRRSRNIQEIFACSALPAEFAASPVQQGPYLYTSPWPYDSVSNADAGNVPTFDATNMARMARADGSPTPVSNTEFVNFTADCQNCHSTQNHRAPMFGVFDQLGMRNGGGQFGQLMVTSSVTGTPLAQIQEYQSAYNPDGPNEAVTPATFLGKSYVAKGAIMWKYGNQGIDLAVNGNNSSGVAGNTVGGSTAVPNFNAFGQQMAADEQTARCMMIRIWNNAYSRDDVVDQLALVPESTIQPLLTYFESNNYNMKKALYQLYTDANFIRF